MLSSPQNYNALSREMIAALRDALDAIATDESVRVVVIAAEGRAFCAGHDLKEMQAGRAGPDKGRAYFADLFARWGIPVILCATTGLGTISHTLSAIESLRARGCPLHGVAFIGDDNPDNIATIAALGGLPVL